MSIEVKNDCFTIFQYVFIIDIENYLWNENSQKVIIRK